MSENHTWPPMMHWKTRKHACFLGDLRRPLETVALEIEIPTTGADQHEPE